MFKTCFVEFDWLKFNSYGVIGNVKYPVCWYVNSSGQSNQRIGLRGIFMMIGMGIYSTTNSKTIYCCIKFYNFNCETFGKSIPKQLENIYLCTIIR